MFTSTLEPPLIPPPPLPPGITWYSCSSGILANSARISSESWKISFERVLGLPAFILKLIRLSAFSFSPPNDEPLAVPTLNDILWISGNFSCNILVISNPISRDTSMRVPVGIRTLMAIISLSVAGKNSVLINWKDRIIVTNKTPNEPITVTARWLTAHSKVLE